MSQRVTDPVLEDIRRRIDIVDLVSSRGIALKRAGVSFKACCPFHHEKTPSFHVNPARQTYHCFGCGAHGDVFKFLMQQETLSFMDAVRALAEKSGVQLSTETDHAAEARNLLYAAHAELAAFYRRCLQQTSGAVARAYLESRKLSAEIVERFGIGYAPDGRETLRQWGAKHAFPPELLVTAGLLSPSNDPRRPDDYFDRFRGRLMFPIRDAQGRVVAFSGRILNPAAPQTAKYVNSPETPIFVKSRVLYALDRSRGAIVKHPRREALVCEGQIDAIRCHASGFDTAVAPLGTAFTRDHVELLKRYADSVVLVFDGDAAGRKAALRAGSLFLAAGLPVRVATLPSGEDPDSLLREKGAQSFRAELEAAVSIVAFQVRVLRETEPAPDSVDAVNRIARAVLETLAGCGHAVLRAHLLQEAAALLHLPVAAFEEDLAGLLKTARHAAARHDPSPPPLQGVSAVESVPAATETGCGNWPTVSQTETSLCELLIHHENDAHVPELLASLLPSDLVAHPFTRRILDAAQTARRTGTDCLAQLNADGDTTFRLFFDKLVRMHSRVETSHDKTPLDAARDLVARLWSDALRTARESADENRRLEIACLVQRLRDSSDWPARETIIRAELARRNAAQAGFREQPPHTP